MATVDARRSLRRSVDVSLVCLALVAIGLWFNLVGYSDAFLAPGLTDSSFEGTRYAYYLGRIAVTALFILVPRLFDRCFGACALCMPLLMCFNTIGYALSYGQTVLPSMTLGMGASFVLGLSYMWIDASLYVLLARMLEPRKAVLAIVIAQMLEQLAGVAANAFVPEAAQILLCGICSLVPLLPLLIVKAPKGSVGSGEKIGGSAGKLFLMLLVMSGVAIVALGAASSVGAWGKIRVDYGSADAGMALVENVLACAIAFACTWFGLMSSSERPISYRYQVSFLIVSCGLLFAMYLNSAVGPSGQMLATVLLTGIEYFAHVLFWVIIVQAMTELERPSYFIAGMGMFFYSVFSFLWILVLETDSILSTLVMFLLACSLIIVSSVHPRLLYERHVPAYRTKRDLNEYGVKGEPYIPLERNGAVVADAVEKRCALLGEEYSLTPRETQVLNLLAQGRSKTVICRMLVLSEGTVKTHTSHIFEKMGVRSHQELLAIVYGDADGAREQGSIESR